MYYQILTYSLPVSTGSSYVKSDNTLGTIHKLLLKPGSKFDTGAMSMTSIIGKTFLIKYFRDGQRLAKGYTATLVILILYTAILVMAKGYTATLVIL